MTQEEQAVQITRARAHLRLLEREADNGRATKAQVVEALERLEALKRYQVREEPPGRASTPASRNAQIPVEQLPLAVRQVLERLAQERNAIHAEKSRLANTLHTIPDALNAKETVTAILQLRQAWKEKQDEIYAVMETGALPLVVVAPAQALPTDPDLVRFQIGRLQSNINKLEKRMVGAKEVGTRRRQAISLAQMNADLAQLKTHLSGL